MRRLRMLVWKEFLELKLNPRLFGVVVIAPILQLTLLGYAATTDINDVPIVVADGDRTQASRELIQRFDASRNFTVIDTVTTVSEIDPFLERGIAWLVLGIPAGYTLSSPVTLAESPYSGLETENLRANLRGFRALFQGCGPEGEGLGFDDWLSEAGHGDLAQDIVTAWTTAQAAADAYPRFAEAGPAELETLYRKVKALTDLLKTDLFGDGSPIGLDLPEGLSSDTD